MDTIFDWLHDRSAVDTNLVERVSLYGLDAWSFTDSPLRLVHDSGRFFSIEGYRVRVSGPSACEFERPMINQPEIGILGFLAQNVGGVLHLLVQAKFEPGNPRQLQLGPTVQATHSNYTRAHGGRATPYLEYFLEAGLGRTLLDEVQPEQTAFFDWKLNRNVVIQIDEDIDVLPTHRWMTLGQLQLCLAVPNLVNMDVRSIVSRMPCLRAWAVSDDVEGADDVGEFETELRVCGNPYVAADGDSESVDRWFGEHRRATRLQVQNVPVNSLSGWSAGDQEIRGGDGQASFAVIGIRVTASQREVSTWSQPMLAREKPGRMGLLMQVRSGVLQMLVQATVDPGCGWGSQLAPTLVMHDGWGDGMEDSPPFASWFADPTRPSVRFAVEQSEEGGRFHRFTNLYMIVQAPTGSEIARPSVNYEWLTMAQLDRMMHLGVVSIELRNLVACLSPWTTSAP